MAQSSVGTEGAASALGGLYPGKRPLRNRELLSPKERDQKLAAGRAIFPVSLKEILQTKRRRW